jgi:hypothetical protein
MTMQHRFYYGLIKRLGLFPNAIFNDTNYTIDFSGGGSSSTDFIIGRSSGVSAGGTKHYSLNAANADSNAGGSNFDSSDITKGEIEKAFRVPKDGVIDLFQVICNTSPVGEDEFFLLTIHVNGVASTLTVTINVGETSAADIVHSVEVEAGDLVVVRIVGAATDGTFRGQWNVRYVS